MEHICVLLLSLPFSSSSACATAKQGSPCIKVGSARVAHIIVVQFKHDLLELGLVTDMSHFDRVRQDGWVHNACTTEDYVKYVFVADRLPTSMSVKSCLSMSTKLGLPDLWRNIEKELLGQAKMVTRAMAHSKYVNFSTSALTLLMSESPSDGNLSDEDAHRPVLAGTRLLVDHYPHVSKRKWDQILRRRPILLHCVRRVVRIVWRKCGSNCRHLIGIACVVTIVLADREGVISPRTNVRGITRAINMYRYLRTYGIKQVVNNCEEGSEEEEEDQSP